MRRLLSLILALALLCAACGSTPPPDVKKDSPAETPAPAPVEESFETGEENMEKTLRLYIEDSEVSVKWEENDSVEALIELVGAAPLTVRMSMYGGFEQVGSLGTSLPRNDSQITAQPGELVLYSANQLVIFYGSNSWAYTRLGKITDKSAAELTELLGNRDVTLTLTLS